MPVSTVHLTFEGMLLMFVKNDTEYCEVAFLRGIPHHSAEIQITSMPRFGAAEILRHLRGSDLNDRLRLEVNKPNPRVRWFRSSAPDPFVRVPTAQNIEDFRWAVNLEGHEVYNTTLKSSIDESKLKQVLRIFDGTFYNQMPLSENELTRKRPGDTGPIRLGKVSVKVRAAIELESGNAVTFVYGTGAGDKLPLPAQPDIDYGIYVSNKREPGHADNHVDAENYHPVIAGRHPKVTFGRHPPTIVEATPDAVCPPGWMGDSTL